MPTPTSMTTPLQLPSLNILHHLFPPSRPISTSPLWFDSANPSRNISPAQAVELGKRLAVGLDQLGDGIRAQSKEGEGQGLGVGAEVIMVVSPNHIMVPAVFLGVLGGGRCFSGANPAYTEAELSYQLKVTTPKVILAHPALLQTVVGAVEKAGLSRNTIYQFSDAPCSPRDGIKDWSTILSSLSSTASYEWPDLSGEASRRTIATVNFSSGTTGLPKGVCVSHHGLIANTEQLKSLMVMENPWANEAVMASFLPIYHAYGQIFACLICVTINANVYFMPKFEIEELCRVVQQYRINILQVVPPVLRALVDRPEALRYDLSSIKDVWCGAAPLPDELRKRIHDQKSYALREVWGMTELTCGGLGVPYTLATKGRDSVGWPLPNIEVKIMKDDGNEAKDGEPGELYVRGPNTFMGYWQNEKATAETKTPDGWLKTGDVFVQRDGELWIVDRKKELIKVKGLQVAPAELEALLYENDNVADAAVVGTETSYGEAPRAYITLKDHAKGKVDETEIQKWFETKASRYKWLTGGVKFVDTIPRLASGKIQRKVVRDWAKQRGGASDSRARL